VGKNPSCAINSEIRAAFREHPNPAEQGNGAIAVGKRRADLPTRAMMTVKAMMPSIKRIIKRSIIILTMSTATARSEAETRPRDKAS
jgi:hypothetical protein